MPQVETQLTYTTFSVDSNVVKDLYDFLFGGMLSFESLIHILLQAWTVYSIIAFLLSIAFIVGIIYSYLLIGQFDEAESERLLEDEKRWKERHSGVVENNRWQSVQIHLESTNPNDWKLAIIEADVLLERMLEKAGFAGNTIGERLKSASVRSFATLDDAWQAHRVRNQIAHGGADFILTQKIAKETLIMYERVFKEFDVI